MFTQFDNLSNESRLWVHVFENELNDAQLNKAIESLTDFCQHWTAHEQALSASFTIVSNRILLIAVDEQFHMASGCSIDKSVKMLEELQVTLANKLLPKDSVLYLDYNGELSVISLKNIESAIQANIIMPDFKSIPTWVSKKADWYTQLHKPLNQTWLKRYFSSVSA